jgi:hypothetical protein
VAKEYRKDIEIDKVTQRLKELKGDIRKYNNRMEPIPRYIVQDNGMDGYIELIEMPETEDPEEWFNENIRQICSQSMYDCTGEAFTWNHKIFRRRGKLMCYHRVAFDF